MNAAGDVPEEGEVWDAAWLEFHAVWRPRLLAFLASVCEPESVDDILREGLLAHRRGWAAVDDPEQAHLGLFRIVLDHVHSRRRPATPRRAEAVVLHDLVGLPVEDVAAIQRTGVRVVRIHLALGHRDPELAADLTVPEDDTGIDHGVELLHTAYENLTEPAAADPADDPEADYALGLVCEQAGDLRGAALCFRRATAHGFEDAADRFVSVLGHLRLPSRGRHARHAMVEPPAPAPADELAIEALVVTSEEGRAMADSLPAEQRAVCGLCVESRAVAEVAARMGVPLDVARTLVGDLASDGIVVVHDVPGADGPPVALMERVLDGLRGP